jgi:hypothetical protein
MILAVLDLPTAPSGTQNQFLLKIRYAMKYHLLRLCAMVFLSLFLGNANAQPDNFPVSTIKKENKPYKLLTSGRQVTVKSTKNIKNIMVWTASGNRIVEQKEVNAATYTFNVSGSREKAFFLMIQYETGKPYTEKIGVQ